MPQEKRILLPQDLKPVKTLEEYKAIGGLVGLEKARSLTPQQAIDLVKQSGLRGRGGAGFPVGVKWQTVYDDPSSTKYVVCNGAEGEPGTYKDRYLLGKNPYWVLEGMLIAAHAMQAPAAVIGTKKKFTHQVQRLQKAVAEFEAAGVAPRGFLEIVLGPDEYLFGEEKALLEVIDGYDAMPRNFPPFFVGIRATPTERNPTLINNVESMSHLPNIFAKGPEWFRAIGTKDTPGTVMITLSGDVKRPGIYELPAGLTLRQLLNDIGGGPSGDQPFKAVFSGVSNAVIMPKMFDAVLDFGSMRAAGAGLGSGGFMVYDAGRCMVKIALMFSGFLAEASCGQCIPCNRGCRIITEHLDALEHGRGSPTDIEDILHECGQCTNQTRCFLPTQESKVMTSLIQNFPEDFERHARQRPCPSAQDLVLPKIEYFDEGTSTFVYEKKRSVASV